MTILPLAYLPSVEYFAHLLCGGCVVDLGEHFVKRSERNRARILATDGVMELTVHVCHANRPRQPVRDVRIDYSKRWQHQHWGALVASYKGSPISIFTLNISNLSTAGNTDSWPITMPNCSVGSAPCCAFPCRSSPRRMSLPPRATPTCVPNGAMRARRSLPSPMCRSSPTVCLSSLICRLRIYCSPRALKPFRF